MLRLLLPVLVILAMLLPVLPAGIASAVTAPTVVTLAATDVTVNSGTIWGNVTATGGENPNVWIVWYQGSLDKSLSQIDERDNDLDEWIAYFQNSVDLGTKPVGTVSLAIGNLSQARVYWRIVARNSAGLKITATAYFDPIAPVAYYSYVPAWDFTPSVGGAGALNLALTWTADDDIDLAAISFFGSGLHRVVTFDVKAVDGAHKPTGSVLASITIADTVDAWNRGDLTTPYSLSNGVEYAFIVRRNGGSNNWPVFGKGTSGLNADCLLWATVDSGANWDSALTYFGYDADLGIRLYTADSLYRVATTGISPLFDSDITETTATLRGTVSTLFDQSYSVSFEYGTTTAYGSSTTPATIYSTGAISAGISSLSAGTLYHYRVKSVGTLGNFTGYSADGTFYTPDYSEEGYTVATGLSLYAVQIANQRKSFYAQGRYWVFFVDTNEYLSYKTSTDGQTFGSANIANGAFTIEDSNDSQFCVAFDGTNVHLVTGRRDHKLAYRMGEPQPSGIVSWDADGLQETIGTAVAGKLYTAPYITVDASGYPWVLVGTCDESNLNVQIFRSSTKDGTFTTAAGYPKTPFTDIGKLFWQRGIILPFDNGDMYFISGKRSLDSGYFNYNGYNKLKGLKYTSGNNTFSAPVDITTTEMDYIGDVNSAPYALFSATSWGDYGYLAFTNTNNELKFLVYNNQTGTWSSETTIETGLPRRTAPAITVHDVDGRVYLFWIEGRTLYYEWRSAVGVWSGTPTAIITENLMNNVANINTWEHSVEGKTAIMYRTQEDSQIGFRCDDNYVMPQMNADLYDIKFITMSTGFSVGTDTPANIAGTSATLQGHLVNDGGEDCDVRFEWGLTSAYGSTTTWQSGFNTGQSFNQAITGLTVNTIYHFRAVARHADLSTVNGADMSFITTTLGAPTVTTVAATGVTNAEATLQGSITSLGDYSPVYAYFQYGLTASYGTTTTEQTKTSVTSYSQAISGLTTSTTYHYRSVIRYNTSSYAYGSDTTLTTTGTVTLGAPTNLSASRSTGQIVLSWTKGSNAVNTMVRRSTTTYPSTISDGVQVYFGTSTGVINTGLTDTQGYYYSAWSEKDGSYTSTYATVYSAPLGGAGVSVLGNPDTLFIGDVKVFRNYQVTGDQLIVFRYEVGYTTTPTQNVIDFFAFELYDGATLKAKTPVRDWGHRPASIYLSSSNTLTYRQAFNLRIVGIVGKWNIVPEGYVSVSASDWDSDINNLDIWVWNEAELINSTDWIAYGAAGTVLTTTGCNVFNRAIPSLSAIRTRVCAFPSGFPNPEDITHGDDYESSLDTAAILGNYTTNAIISAMEIIGAESDNTAKTMGLIIGCALLFLLVGVVSKNLMLGMAATSPLLIFGTYAGLIPFAPTMIVVAILILYGVRRLWPS